MIGQPEGVLPVLEQALGKEGAERNLKAVRCSNPILQDSLLTVVGNSQARDL